MFITVKNHLFFMHSDNHDKRGIIRKHPLPSITAADFTVSNNPLFERKLELATEGLASENKKDFPLIPGRYDIDCIGTLVCSIQYSTSLLPFLTGLVG